MSIRYCVVCARMPIQIILISFSGGDLVQCLRGRKVPTNFLPSRKLLQSSSKNLQKTEYCQSSCGSRSESHFPFSRLMHQVIVLAAPHFLDQQELISYRYRYSSCCFCCSSCWGNLFKKPKAPSFQIGSG